jgi:hypothetical protein
MKQPGLDHRHRDKDGEISKKHGNTLISTLRRQYGAHFAPGEPDNAKLGDVLHRLDEPLLTRLVDDLRVAKR